jgi:tripartite-type tricarboxylate transporter receptor subunit TctC
MGTHDDNIRTKSGEGPMTVLFRVVTCAIGLVLASFTVPQGVSAQTYPTRSVRMVVPFAAAGPTDVIARILAQKLSENLGQQFYGAGPAITSTIGGHTPIAFTALPPAMASIQDGKLRGLAVLADKRVAGLPDVPTMAEAGVPDQEADTLVVPAATPAEIIDLLHREIAKIVVPA